MGFILDLEVYAAKNHLFQVVVVVLVIRHNVAKGMQQLQAAATNHSGVLKVRYLYMVKIKLNKRGQSLRFSTR